MRISLGLCHGCGLPGCHDTFGCKKRQRMRAATTSTTERAEPGRCAGFACIPSECTVATCAGRPGNLATRGLPKTNTETKTSRSAVCSCVRQRLWRPRPLADNGLCRVRSPVHALGVVFVCVVVHMILLSFGSVFSLPGFLGVFRLVIFGVSWFIFHVFQGCFGR